MPLITKAKSKKPKWQKGNKPDKRAQKDAWALSAEHEKKFESAYRKMLSGLLDDKFRKIVRKAVNNGKTVNSVLNQLPFFDPKKPDTFGVWDKLAKELEKTYAQVIQSTVENEAERRGWAISFKKTDAETAQDFIRLRSLTMTVDMSDKERERIRAILKRLFKKNSGTGKKEAIQEIFDNVGLTVKQQAMVERKIAAAAELGMGAGQAAAIGADLAGRLRSMRARAISRTETADAINNGLRESWRQAEEQGLMPEGTKKRWVRFIDDRSSEICGRLENQVVGLNDRFSTDGFEGQGPPAHPNCRSTLELVFP